MNQLNFVIGVEHVKGDMFESVPQGDAIFMKVSLSLFQYLLLILTNILVVILTFKTKGFCIT